MRIRTPLLVLLAPAPLALLALLAMLIAGAPARTESPSAAPLPAESLPSAVPTPRAQPSPAARAQYEVHDAHFHLTNYVQRGTDMGDFVRRMMGRTVGRSTVFGIPLQQTWSHANTGAFAPTYYLETDAPLYYYSFTDAMIATAYLSLTPEEQARLDPMITGFNPADMYGVDHIRRVLLTYPGVFSGIGEFTIHKEFVSAKIAGETPSLWNPALDRILDFAEETGLVVIVHCDLDVPFPKTESEADDHRIRQLEQLFLRHPKATIIWAHLGVGRVVRPVPSQLALMDRALSRPELSHVYFDLSWSELAKYIVASPATIQATAAVINAHPQRFLFGTDEVAPKNQAEYLAVFRDYAPLLAALTPEASAMVRKGNYERLFDTARRKVRSWEKANRTATVKESAR